MIACDVILVRFGELFLKGRNRRLFVQRLIEGMRHRLSDFPALRIRHNNHSALIILRGEDPQQCIEKLNTLFGIQSYGLGFLCKKDMTAIAREAEIQLPQLYTPQTKIRFSARRSSKDFPHDSIVISQILARHINENTYLDAAVHDPDISVQVQIRKKDALLLCKNIPGLGGMPVGSAGKTLLMLSGGIDSPAAAYLLMKRGLFVQAVHFESPPHTTIKSRQKVFDLAQKLAAFMPDRKLTVHTVPFTDIQRQIHALIPEDYTMTILRRMMYRISHHFAKNKSIPVLSTGECIGQVASQTVESMAAINEVTPLPVLRPVVCMDKTEIIALARRIDTYEISIRPYEDCCTVFLPKKPATKPKGYMAQRFEEKLDIDRLVHECLEGIKSHTVEADKPYILDSSTTEEICDLL
jgi:thiamine biosynthesis protein ThiI